MIGIQAPQLSQSVRLGASVTGIQIYHEISLWSRL